MSGRNKYSGNYGIRSQASAPQNPYKGRGYSLDRSRSSSRFTSPSRAASSSVGGGHGHVMTRTRSQVLLGAPGPAGGGQGFSSGEDSYGSRPPSSSHIPGTVQLHKFLMPH